MSFFLVKVFVYSDFMSSKDGGGDWDDKNYPKEMSQDHDAMSLVLFVCMCVRERETVCV